MSRQSRLPANLLRQLALLAGAFASATLLAKLLGAGWGTASGFGQMAFGSTLVLVLLRTR